MRAALQRLVRDLRVRGEHVELHAVGRLGDHLERALQDADGEVGRGVGGHPQPEVLLRRLELLQQLLQGLEPVGQQVAVLQHHPVAALRAHLEHGLRNRALPLAERHELHLGPAHAHGVSKLEDVRGGVGAGREHEDDRHGRGRLPQHLLEVERRRADELLTHELDDELGDGHVDAVDAEAAQYEHLLERR